MTTPSLIAFNFHLKKLSRIAPELAVAIHELKKMEYLTNQVEHICDVELRKQYSKNLEDTFFVLEDLVRKITAQKKSQISLEREKKSLVTKLEHKKSIMDMVTYHRREVCFSELIKRVLHPTIYWSVGYLLYGKIKIIAYLCYAIACYGSLILLIFLAICITALLTNEKKLRTDISMLEEKLRIPNPGAELIEKHIINMTFELTRRFREFETIAYGIVSKDIGQKPKDLIETSDRLDRTFQATNDHFLDP